ncbi:MAG: PilN domain-containing protein [Candidatus Zapsychrus exili]|nr:PilN domain-containing protein [Candidatus Zapsychrus exili]
MIEINVAPNSLRKKRRSSFSLGLNMPIEIVVGSVAGMIIALVVAHLLLVFISTVQLIKYKGLETRWSTMQPLKKSADRVISEMRLLQGKNKDIQGIMGDNKILWSKKLNVLSDILPKGVWLKKISLSENKFFIEGSAISRQKTEMANVHKFTLNLKGSESFLDNFEDLELGAINRKKVEKIEVADFLITVKIKENEQ